MFAYLCSQNLTHVALVLQLYTSLQHPKMITLSRIAFYSIHYRGDTSLLCHYRAVMQCHKNVLLWENVITTIIPKGNNAWLSLQVQ